MTKSDPSFSLLPPVARSSSNSRDGADMSFPDTYGHNQEYLRPLGRGKVTEKLEVSSHPERSSRNPREEKGEQRSCQIWQTDFLSVTATVEANEVGVSGEE